MSDFGKAGTRAPVHEKPPNDQSKTPNSVGTTVPPLASAGKEGGHFEDLHGYHGTGQGPH